MANAGRAVSNGARPTVLVVDDNDALRAVVHRALEAANLNVISVDTCGRGLAVLDSQPVAALLTDLSLPDMSGWEFCKLARKRRPGIAMGIMTGWGVPADDDTLANNGIRFVVAKPFNLRELQALVVEAVNS
jgi:DNA-binding response OmpR family regulator